ncbi:MAG: hypothetical protein Q9174_002909 [Haloplaca sp. 1 TL-2023]
MAMKVDPDYGPPSHDDFDTGHWVHVTDDQSPHHSPLNEFNGFYMPTASYMGLDSIYSRPPTTSQPPGQTLHPLIVPQWPSQLTNPSMSPPSSTPQSTSSAPANIPRPIAPLTTPVEPKSATQSAPPAPVPIPTPPSGRRTLTDQDRRRMCQYHDENPTVKQTEIGVLRHKEKYLHPDDGSRSPIKRSKGKFPDIERAVSNWAKNHQRQGLPLNNEMIRDKARIFASTVGSSDCITKVNSPVWLEKFKQKNGLLGASVPESSEAEDSDMGQAPDPASGNQTPHRISPISPTEQPHGLPDLEMRDSESTKRYVDFHPTFRRAHSASDQSLGSYFTDNQIASKFSPGARSPTSPIFSPPSSCGPSPSVPSQTPRLPRLAPADSRPRRQTFPTITPPASASSDTTTNSRLLQQSMATSAMESPMEEMEDSTFGMDATMHDARLRSASSTPASNNISPSSMAPPPNPPMVSTSASSPVNITAPMATSSPSSSPSQDEARRALEIVMSFFQSQGSAAMDPQDYITMGKLMEKLKIRGYELPGGMRSMMEARGDGTLPMGTKRSIHSLS